MAAGHLTAALLTPSSSPVLAVGSTVIDLTPTPLKEYAVREFGTRDKPILLATVIAVTLLLAAIAGWLSRKHFAVGVVFLLVLVALAGAAALTRPLATLEDLIPAVVTAIMGLAVLFLLVRHPSPKRMRHPMRQAELAEQPMSRRMVLIASGVVASMTGLMAWGGERIIARRTNPGSITLPPPADPAPPLPRGIEQSYRGISRLQTPTDTFYRVDTNLTLPVVSVDDWTLTIDGDVENEFTLTFDELAAMPLVERDITMTCVSNEVGGRYVGAARWLGVPLTALFERAGVGTKADQILSTAVDGFTISTPLDVATDGRDAMVAIGMNGKSLKAEHGFPARLITPGIYGFVGATKWLTKLTLTTYAKETAYWTDRKWATDAPIKIASRIDTPRPLSTIDAGRVVIGGVAWAQTRGIERVEIRIDGGPWQPTRLGPDVGVDYWRQWYQFWDAEPGRHMLAVRAIGADGEVQTPVRATPFPAGSSGIQEIVISVR
ncbi:DMSO/TMAO reductase YedYZ molybdopterin-dependent catalytic subunit [Nocardioides daedukensis]|uniref:DMSO/TMAO reductase YedYZ molybdopterin-dependent catalytic subunit n=1 Tax=Nocardioides daedukensis TaxID=634462 RepID=A0A7Y9S2X0_9ACTN|nr:molybdopterin-dependent oxidoreductase [Nocardioides daedukensis]NYG59073.1 DMSO/TMAO reductase YedYZ molybdopterin-dependent catalytic subunit [Nocardioides daedukensis]